MKNLLRFLLVVALALPLVGAVTIRESGVTGCGLFYSDEVVAETLPVTGWAGQGFRTIVRTVANVQPGDLVEARGRWRAENRTGYLVGVGTHLWGYDVDGDTSVWWRIGPSAGDNVTPDRKYVPLYVDAVWTVPDDWPAGHRLAIVVRGDAHSTAAQPGDTVDVTPNGTVTASVWRTGC